jgi:type II secretion system protein H
MRLNGYSSSISTRFQDSSPGKRSLLCCSSPRTLHAALFSGFTLIELILVMAILTMAVAVTAPTLSNFFRGRSLDSEARRLLALTRAGQSRAATEGVPMDLWVDTNQKTFGLEAEPSYEDKDSKAVSYPLDNGLQMEVVNRSASFTANSLSRNLGHAATFSAPKVTLSHPGLPTIRFLPDGSISDSSPQMLRLTARDGSYLCLAQSRDHLTYEIRATDQ